MIEAEEWLQSISTRYVRLCRRRVRGLVISNERLRETVLASVPAVVEDEYKRQFFFRVESMDDTFCRLQEVEEMLKERNHGPLPQSLRPMHALPANDGENTPSTSTDAKMSRWNKVPRKPCPGCGGAHWYYKECPKRDNRCWNCQEVGHVSINCPHSVKKDTKGCITSKTRHLQSKTEHVVPHDRTAGDRMDTVAEAVNIIKSQIIKAVKDRRAFKMEKTGQKLKPQKEYPVAVAADDASEESESDNDVSTAILESLGDSFAIPVKSDKTIPIEVTLGGDTISAIIDTGTWYSLIPPGFVTKYINYYTMPFPRCGTRRRQPYRASCGSSF